MLVIVWTESEYRLDLWDRTLFAEPRRPGVSGARRIGASSSGHSTLTQQDTAQSELPLDQPMTPPEAAADRYDAADIDVLEGIEAVRRRPGMYIGSTGQAGLHHLVYEIVDNAVDEAMAGHATRIEVSLQPEGWVQVRDDGRGIPTDQHAKTGRSALETVLTVLHAGGKFGGGGYKVSGGLHGVGASVVNALASQLEVEVRRDGQSHTQSYVRGVPIGEVERSSMPKDAAPPTGTMVRWVADAEVIDHLEYDFHTLAQRFREIAYLNKGLWICFRDERQFPPDASDDERLALSPTAEKNFHFEGGIQSYVRFLNRDREVLQPLPFHLDREVAGNGSPVAVEVAIQYNGDFQGLGVRVCEHDQHARGRIASDGISLRVDAGDQRLRATQQTVGRQGSQYHRRGHARGADRGRFGEAGRAAVRGTDEDQAGQP